MHKLVTVQPKVKLSDMSAYRGIRSDIGNTTVLVASNNAFFGKNVKKFGIDYRMGTLLSPAFSMHLHEGAKELIRIGDVVYFYAEDRSRPTRKPIRCNFKVDIIGDSGEYFGEPGDTFVSGNIVFDNPQFGMEIMSIFTVDKMNMGKQLDLMAKRMKLGVFRHKLTEESICVTDYSDCHTYVEVFEKINLRSKHTLLRIDEHYYLHAIYVEDKNVITPMELSNPQMYELLTMKAFKSQ